MPLSVIHFQAVSPAARRALSFAARYHSDFDLFERALRDAGLRDHLQNVIKPTHVGYLIGQPDVEEAMETSWTASFVADRIGRHHALADARALRAGFAAMHGGGPATHLGRFDG